MLARADCLRRRGAGALPSLRSTFGEAAQLLGAYFKDHVDPSHRCESCLLAASLLRACWAAILPSCPRPSMAPPAAPLTPCPTPQPPLHRLTAYWADCEAELGGDAKAGRAVWEAALKGPAGRCADAWLAAVEYERRHGGAREARTLFKRCYA